MHIDRSPPHVNVTSVVGRDPITLKPDSSLRITLDIDDGPGSGLGYAYCRLKKRVNEYFYETTYASNECDKSPDLEWNRLPDATYYFEVTARDNVGNNIFFLSEAIRTDTVGPELVFGNFTKVGNGSTVAITFGEDLRPGRGRAGAPSDLDQYTCTLKSGLTGEVLSTEVGCTSPHTLANLENGNYAFDLRATDKSGNAAKVKTYYFVVDVVEEEGEKAKTSGLLGLVGYRGSPWLVVQIGLSLAFVCIVLSLVVRYKQRRRRKKASVAATEAVIGIPVHQDPTSFHRAYSGPSAPGLAHDDADCTPVVELQPSVYTHTNYQPDYQISPR